MASTQFEIVDRVLHPRHRWNQIKFRVLSVYRLPQTRDSETINSIECVVHDVEIMSSIAKKEFNELALDGSNYLTWALDIEIHLASKELSQIIVAKSQCITAQKSLKDRFDQQSSTVLPQAQFDWLHLRFQDYKSVIDYNSALHKIVSQLKLCKQEVSETDLIEKTLSTFHASNLVLQHQYRAKNYEKYSDIISAFLVAEKHNQLLMKNHNARPVGSAPAP
ncbi:PREDICTED: uncharacterized protein LOC109180673 [Ipomoea nil]|uniref:uncharacterized protein LOC109180673 n=1 Tax=Ipomoea nil TaxID=35883 RepID=UPI0009014802|nr:PREDICTED: uncharacterized protein LOC109180673 [Ipomoea nil]